MSQVFSHKTFDFPYHNLSFPGQHSEEKILFATREGKLMLYFRLCLVILTVTALLIANFLISKILKPYLPNLFPSLSLTLTLTTIIFGLIGLFWIYALWKKSIFIITNRRLTKFISNTPFTRYQLSLGLDKIVDTGAYQKGYFQALTGYGYFVARSAAGNIKNFKIINISFAEDLHNYVNKLLYTFNKEKEKLDMFRPFIPHLKGDARKEFVKKVAPEYYQDQSPS